MNNYRLINPKFFMVAAIVVIGFMFLFSGIAYTSCDPFCTYYLPDSVCLMYCQMYCFYTGYCYFNTINGHLLGYAPFTPFLVPDLSVAYNLAGIPTYPYFGSPYQTTFPYQTLPGTIIPYTRFDYPAYAYGSPGFYRSWVLLQ